MQSDLHKIIVSPQPLSSDHVKVFLYQILRGKSINNLYCLAHLLVDSVVYIVGQKVWALTAVKAYCAFFSFLNVIKYASLYLRTN